MKCPKCRAEMVKVDLAGESFCPKCTKCRRCNLKPATIDKFLGILDCPECRARIRPKDKLRSFHVTQKALEHFATPFWRHMGLPAKPHEKVMEKWMKSKNMGYADLQRLRNYKGRFNNTELVNKLEKGELHGRPDISYNRE